VLRITCPDAPVPHSEALERRFVPSPEYVAEQTSQLIETGRPPAPWWAREEKS
jgi:acetoin:2,6-dichlorophenolindophenol oxidoreductase subunit beta